MSASARSAPARGVRRVYPKAYAIQLTEGRWHICNPSAANKDGTPSIGSGPSRLAAWRDAYARIPV